MAKGEYVIIFHDDDIIKPELLEKEVEVLDNDNQVVLVTVSASLIDENGNILIEKEKGSCYFPRILGKNEFIDIYLRTNFGFCFSSIMIRRKFLMDNNLKFRNEVGPNADSYMWMEINLYDKKIVYLHDVLLSYRIHKEQESRLDTFNRWILGYRYSMDLIENNSLNHIKPYFKRNATNYLISILSKNLTYGNITKEEFKEKLNDIK